MTAPRLQRLCLLLAASATVAALSACAPMVVGGAAMVGSMVAMDRRTAGTQLEDEGIEIRAASALREQIGDRAHINVTSYNRLLLLTGEVPTEQDRVLAEQLGGRVQNVRGVVNELAVLGNSSLSQRSNDALVTARVKGVLLESRELSYNGFKVIPGRGVLYMMGRVTEREAARATELFRGVNGVQKVVRSLEIISEQELRELQARPAANR